MRGLQMLTAEERDSSSNPHGAEREDCTSYCRTTSPLATQCCAAGLLRVDNVREERTDVA